MWLVKYNDEIAQPMFPIAYQNIFRELYQRL
jgi:hypothetical protein